MNNDTEQKLANQHFQALIEESNRHKKLKSFYKILQIIATPLFITFISMVVTCSINVQQREDTEKITEMQIKSAQIIAAANRENSAKISESNQRTERLIQIKDIFTKLLTKKEEEEDLTDTEIETHRMQIISLEVYKGDALPFLLNIKEHYQKSQDESRDKAYDTLIDQAGRSIYNILLNSQIDVSRQLFVDCGAPPCKDRILRDLRNYRAKFMGSFEAKLETINISIDFKNFFMRYDLNEMNMRQQEYKNYNFSECSFINVNLYKADFSSCTMNDNLFMGADLQEASFSGSDLSGSIFWKSNLKKADFMESRLRDVVFVNPILNQRVAKEAVKNFCYENNCCELEGARFLLGSLLWTSSPPFDIFDIEYAKTEDIDKKELKEERRQLYINLLTHHIQSIGDMIEAAEKGDQKQKDDLENLIKNTGTINQEGLIKHLEEAAEKAKILATSTTAHKTTLFSKR